MSYATFPVEMMTAGDRQLLTGYLQAKRFVIEAGFEREVVGAENLIGRRVTPSVVMMECAHVIVCSGFRYSVVKKLWPGLWVAFREFNPMLIDDSCKPAALAVLNHEKKIDAIVEIARLIRAGKWLGWHMEAQIAPEALARLPYIGKVTCWHLAKLLGADVIKPDVHLTRAAKVLAKCKIGDCNSDPGLMCYRLNDLSGDHLTVIDSVLWRWAEQKQATEADWRQLWSGQ